MDQTGYSDKQKNLLKDHRKTLIFGYSVMKKVSLNIKKVRFKKQLLYLHMGAIHSFSEAILKLIETRPIYDKAAEVLMRSIIELYINISFIYAGRNQQNAFIFLADSIQDKIDFAFKHREFWKKHPQWKLTFGKTILSYNDWDKFIDDKEKELKILSKKYKYKIPKKIPDIRRRAIIFDNYLLEIGQMKEYRSMEKNYVLFYKYFSQIAHLTILGLDRFFLTDNKDSLHMIVDGKSEDIERIVIITHHWYIGLLKFFSKQFHTYKKQEFKLYADMIKVYM